MDAFHQLFEKIRDAFTPFLRAWDGAASNYADTAEYCDASLINVNAASGRTDRDDWVQTHCKLPVKAPDSDAFDFEGIQAAAGVLAGARGGVTKPDDVPQDDWDKQLKAAANTVITQYNANDETAPDAVYELAGKTPPEERTMSFNRISQQVSDILYEQISDEWAWLLDLYLDDGSMYALAAAGGLLYRYPVTVTGEDVTLGERVQVTEIHQPVGRAGIQVHRQADGRYRFTLIAATAVLNRMGEIDSRELFANFVRRAEEGEDYPVYQFYHQGERFRLGQVDFLAVDDATYIASGLYDDEAENALAGAARRRAQDESEYWGNSIGYDPIGEPDMIEVAEGINVPVYRDGINREISMLPECDAAAWFTALRATSQEVLRMNKKTKEALEKLLADDPEALTEFADLVDRTNERAAGLLTRDTEPPAAEVPETTETAAETPAEPETAGDEVVRTVEMDQEALEAIVARVSELEPFRMFGEALDAATEALEALGRQVGENRVRAEREANGHAERLDALEVDEDDKRRQWQADLPARQRLHVSYRPRDAHAPENGEQQPALADVAAGTLDSMD